MNLTAPHSILFWWALIWVGGVFAGISAIMLRKSRKLTQRGVAARGEIVELVKRVDEDGCLYTPRFRYTSRDGREFRVLSSVGTNPATFRMGQAVRILYDPDDPHTAEINSIGQLWAIPGLFAVLGLIAIGLGVAGLITQVMGE